MLEPTRSMIFGLGSGPDDKNLFKPGPGNVRFRLLQNDGNLNHFRRRCRRLRVDSIDIDEDDEDNLDLTLGGRICFDEMMVCDFGWSSGTCKCMTDFSCESVGIAGGSGAVTVTVGLLYNVGLTICTQ
ncbi:unnamed protein product [Didymodactylos carnosus]|uniref:Uncharacterized protein n=1 Tax=Didymodactylos carnosus TaxID=1234261 RepID=A0A8S2CZV4_9BILA|nr:unnamed protein product [Didymodactylos carnosus]CAF3630002.1 unnamed protein product [Didymodactylos carnosus]